MMAMADDNEILSIEDDLILHAKLLGTENKVRAFLIVVIDEDDGVIWSSEGASTLELLGALSVTTSQLHGGDDDDSELQ
jgi:hypothetical protein